MSTPPLDPEQIYLSASEVTGTLTSMDDTYQRMAGYKAQITELTQQAASEEAALETLIPQLKEKIAALNALLTSNDG